MSACSSAPAVKAKLIELLTARVPLASVQIEWAHPGKNLEREAVFFGRVRGNEKWASLGGLAKDEDYIADVVVMVVEPGTDAQAAEERMWEIHAEIEACLRENPTLQDTVDVHVGLGPFEQETYEEGDGYVCVLVAGLQTRNRKRLT